ncbi:MAG: 50S ribosomal protein L3 [Candidatus Aenigmatarchaeota archaeon]
MPTVKVPRGGSLGFVPKKRAKKIYPEINKVKETEKLRISGFAGYKAGMIQVVITDNKKGSPTYGEQITVPATVLECPSIFVAGIRFYKQYKNGFQPLTEIWDEKVLKDKDIKRKVKLPNKYDHKGKLKEVEKIIQEIKKVRLLVRTQPRKSGLGKKKPEIFEIEVTGKDVNEKLKYSLEILGKELKAKDIFRDGEIVDVIAVTKGKGWEGPVRRFGLKIRPRKHQGRRRHVGSMGPETPRMIKWTIPQAGQYGFFRRTEYNKRIIKIGEKGVEVTPKSGFKNYGVVKGDYMIIEGSVPGPSKRTILIRPGIRSQVPLMPTEVKEIVK